MYVHLVATGHRILNRAAAQGKLDAARAALPELLAGYAEGKCQNYFWHPDDGPRARALRSSTITAGELEEQAESAAARVLADWDPDYIARRREMGRKGGLTSTHGAIYTHDRLDGLEGLTVAQQAEAIGCSEHTVSSLRAARKAAGLPV